MKSVGRLIYSVIVVTIVPVPTASNSPSYRRVMQLVYRRCSFISNLSTFGTLFVRLASLVSCDTNKPGGGRGVG